MKEVNHNFRPPKRTELKKWEAARILIENGFIYHHIYETVEKKKE